MERLHPWSGERESRFERSREGGGIGTWEHGRSDLEVKPQREMKRVPAHGVLWHGCGVAPPLARGADARSARRGDTGSSACRRRLRENHPRAGCELRRPPCAIGSPRARRPRRDRLLGSDAQDEGPDGERSSPTACGDPRRAPSPTRAGGKERGPGSGGRTGLLSGRRGVQVGSSSVLQHDGPHGPRLPRDALVVERRYHQPGGGSR